VPSPSAAELPAPGGQTKPQPLPTADGDVNLVLQERHATGKPLTSTRPMLWDVQARKTARLGVYMPFVVG
jgi:hypothetical protein